MKIKDKILLAVKKIERLDVQKAEQTASVVEVLFTAFKEENGSLWHVLRGVKDHEDIWYEHNTNIRSYISDQKLRKKVLYFSGQEDTDLMRTISERVVEKILSDD